MASITPPLFPLTPRSAFIAVLCSSILSASAADKVVPEPRPQFRFDTPLGTEARLEKLTLDQAYEAALATDESIRLAYFSIRKARLVRWSALTRLEPKISGAIGRRDNDENRTTSENYSEKRSSTSDNTSNRFGSESMSEQNLTKNSATQENFFRNEQSFSRTPNESILNRSRDSLTGNTVRDTATIILEQPLLDLTVFPAYRLGRLAEQSAQLQFQFTVRDVLLGVARAYYDTLKAERILEVNLQTLELCGKQLVLAQQRFDAGTALRTEVLRAESTQGEARRLVILSTNTRDIARDTLRSIIDRPNSSFRVVDPAHGIRPALATPELLQRALTQREDYKTSSSLVAQEIERRNEVAAGFMPRVVAELRARSLDYSNNASVRSRDRRSESSSESSLDFGSEGSTGTERLSNPPGSPIVVGPSRSFGTSQTATNSPPRTSEQRSRRTNSRYSASETEWEAILKVEMPLGGALAVELREARYLIADAELNREKVAKTIEREVFDASTQVNTLAQTLNLLRAQVDAAANNYKDLQSQYEAGTATSVDLLVALRDVNSARTQLVSDTYDYEFALRNLQRTTGEFENQRVLSVRYADFGKRSKSPAVPAPRVAPAKAPSKPTPAPAAARPKKQ